MKRFLILITALLSCSVVNALYNGNPSEPELIDEGFFLSKENWASIKVGYQGDFVFNRMLKARHGVQGRIDDFRYLMNQGVFIINFQDGYELYGSAGAMNAYIDDRPHFDNKRREYETYDQFTWGVGGKAIVFRWRASQIGLDAKYQEANPQVKWNTVNGVSYPTHARLLYREWQVGAGVSHHIDIFTPYLVFKYSNVHAKLEHIPSDILNVSEFKMRSRNRWGLALGCSLATGKLVDLNFEVDLFDETAFNLAGSVKF